ncbi:MAG: anti-sigma F factor [Faecalibacterium sp.]|nr:anti-sigma F factor [Ruminococcus sp.]MCM1392985.1 anti-sigma F factor [Ruminococcus sp.]MCM1486521.1 anti-sigma F factor [Faecalibacterium sp.]
MINEMKMVIDSRSINEGFSRVAVSAFVAALDPTVEELTDIKTAVSEAVTNCIVHGYRESMGKIYITVGITDTNAVRIRIRDRGVGIENIEQAMQPLFTTAGDERAGLGFAVMESFMDKIKVTSKPGKGTCVTLTKHIGGKTV